MALNNILEALYKATEGRGKLLEARYMNGSLTAE
jgi:hypothetical protein